eukprot:INCI9374.2.p1 GENE.INCI9374.2~~INCI9374.2.p1  ORF type:complete len:898 (-),score=183.27 INCI9374.2:814-3507(-)
MLAARRWLRSSLLRRNNVGRSYLRANGPQSRTQMVSLRSSSASAQTVPIEQDDFVHIRNIGVLAHVDAGKTTTTERMLYYAGKVRALGNVDSGDTTTDFMKQERERGITIASAAITFEWDGHRINLVDTPGHIDFTVEVERSLRVLDGAVVVVDAVSGVQAQTRTVWKQCETYGVPRIAFVNKMDRIGASLERAAASLEQAFGVVPLVVQMPLGEFGVGSSGGGGGAESMSLVDLVAMELIEWDDADGLSLRRRAVSRENCGDNLYQRIAAQREQLIDDITRCDDDFAELFLELMEEEDDPAAAVSTESLTQALRRITGVAKSAPVGHRKSQMGCVVTCGAAARNRGVQPLLDAVNAYLPAPCDGPGTVAQIVSESKSRFKRRKGQRKKSGADENDNSGDGNEDTIVLPCDVDGPLCALAFKVVHSPQGPLTMVRVYSGELSTGQMVYNISHALREQEEAAQHVTLGKRARKKGGNSSGNKSVERAHRVLEIEAESMLELPRVVAGNIAAIHGLQSIRSGDTLISGDAARSGSGKKGKQLSAAQSLVLPGFDIPPAVFALSVEAESSSQEAKLADALAQLQLEDPSLVVEEDEDSGQTMMRGMGELHLDVAKNRLRDEFGLDVFFGAMRIAFRETVTDLTPIQVEEHFSAGENVGSASVTIEIQAAAPSDGELTPNYDVSVLPDAEDAESINSWIRVTSSGADDSHKLSKTQLQTLGSAIVDGIDDGLCNGPLHGYPVSGVEVTVVEGSVELSQADGNDGNQSSHMACARAAAARAVQKALRKASAALLEPVMDVEIDVPEVRMGAVMSDISGTRRGTVDSFEVLRGAGDESDASGILDAEVLATIRATVPLAELLGYSTALRTLTAGEASFASSFQSYQPLPQKARSELEKAGALN